MLLGLLGDDFQSLEDFTGEEEIGLLRDILLYHVLGQELSSDNFNTGEVTTLSHSNTLQFVGEEDDFVLVDALQRHGLRDRIRVICSGKGINPAPVAGAQWST